MPSKSQRQPDKQPGNQNQNQNQNRATQSVTIIRNRNSNTGRYILISRKTGFMDVTVNGQRFYYNNRASLPMNGQFNINTAIRNTNISSTSKPRQTIIITKKR